MNPRDSVLAMTLVVRDEEEILATHLDYHLAQGIDVILVTDHGSSDRTPEILADYTRDARVRSWREDGPEYRQADWVRRMLGVARDEHGADWVLHGDADEFWVPLIGTLQDVFEAIPGRYGFLTVPRHTFLPTSLGSDPFYARMTLRHRVSKYATGARVLPKVAQRPGAGTGLFRGNHVLERPAMPAAPDSGTVEIHHFQVRSYEQLLRRMKRAEVTGDLGGGLSPETLRVRGVYRDGRLPEFYEKLALDPARAAAGLETGELVFDDRVKRFLEGGGTESGSAEARRALAGLWQRAVLWERAGERERRRRAMRWRHPLDAVTGRWRGSRAPGPAGRAAARSQSWRWPA